MLFFNMFISLNAKTTFSSFFFQTSLKKFKIHTHTHTDTHTHTHIHKRKKGKKLTGFRKTRKTGKIFKSNVDKSNKMF